VADGPSWREDEHDVRRWCRLLEAYGCPCDPDDLRLGAAPATLAEPTNAAESSHDGPVLIHPGASGPARRWPANRYAEVARAVADRGLTVLITAGPGERLLGERVATGAGLTADCVVSGLDLAELADVVCGSRAVVCADTGLAHLATACDTPSVVLFGPVSPARWGPPASPRHRVLWRSAAGDDDAPTDRPHPSLLRIRPSDVVHEIDDLLGHLVPRSPRKELEP
jgi:ADP-heptose:LPS heptosyltransferase